MSGVIWGIIQMDNKGLSLNLGKSMMDKLGLYKLDKVDYISNKNVFMGCGIQYITRESRHETLPAYDEGRDLIITADAIIDNREELFDIFKISKDSRRDVTDSQLIIMSYEKWGQDCPKYLVGDFAFAIWDKKKQELFCARDHVGKRTFYYHYSNNIFAFCTLMKPLFKVYNKRVELNERWITDFLAMTSVIHECECNETVYQGIYQLLPAYTCTISRIKFEKNQYWNPVKELVPLKLKSDEEYDEAFKKVFFEAVHCRLRSDSDIGIMLSGGLDSGSVACIAAKKLLEKDKQLYAFSSIPMREFKDKTPKRVIADESEYIEAIREYSGNIDVTYCRSEGNHSLKDIEWFVDVFEQPYKIVENTFWSNDIAKHSSEKGCKVLLDGQYGNFTISYGDFLVHALTLYRGRKLITLVKEIYGYRKLYKVRPYRIYKAVIKAVMPYKIAKFINHKRNREFDRFEKSPVNIHLLEKWNIESRFDEKQLQVKTQKYLDLNEIHNLVLNPVMLCQAGALETKEALVHGILKRDPTRDKRVIEFCLSLPSDQFVRNGKERYLIRRSMNGIIPDKVRLNFKTRGIQAADWIQRIVPEWSLMCDILEQQLNNKISKQYINVNKIKKVLATMRESPDQNEWYTVRMLIITFILGEFTKTYNE